MGGVADAVCDRRKKRRDAAARAGRGAGGGRDQRRPGRGGAQLIEQGHEIAQGVVGPGRQLPAPHSQLDRTIEGDLLGAGDLEESVEGSLADPPGGDVQDPAQGEIVISVHQDPEVSHHVLDFLPLVEAHRSDDLMGDPLPQEDLLEQPRLVVGPVEHGDLFEPPASRGHRTNEAQDLLGFRAVVLGDRQLERLARRVVGPEGLADPRSVVGDDRIRCGEDCPRGAVVLLELDDGRVGVVGLEVKNVADVRSSPGKNRIVRHDAVGDEVMRSLDVQVEDVLLEVHPLDRFHAVVAGMRVEKSHPRAEARGRQEGEGVGFDEGTIVFPQTGVEDEAEVESLSDAVDGLQEGSEGLACRLEPPAPRIRPRRTDAETERFEPPPSLEIVSYYRDAMQRPRPPAVPAKRHDHVAASGVPRPREVMRMVQGEAVVCEEPCRGMCGVE